MYYFTLLLSFMLMLTAQTDSPSNNKFSPKIQNHLNKLKIKNLSEYQRLKELIRTNPQKFHQEMRSQFAKNFFLNKNITKKHLSPHIIKYLNKIKKNDADEHKRLQELLKTDPETFHKEIALKLNKNHNRIAKSSKKIIPYMRKLSKTDPKRYEKLKKLFIEDPQKFRQEVAKSFLEQQQDKINKQQEILNKLKHQAVLYSQLPEGVEKTQAYEQLHSAVTLKTDANLKEKRTLFEELQKKLKALEKHIKAIEYRRDQIIEQQVLRLINSTEKDD